MHVKDIAVLLVTLHLDLVNGIVLIVLPEPHNAFEDRQSPETSNLV